MMRIVVLNESGKRGQNFWPPLMKTNLPAKCATNLILHRRWQQKTRVKKLIIKFIINVAT